MAHAAIEPGSVGLDPFCARARNVGQPGLPDDTPHLFGLHLDADLI
jgi:hypothetical protein